MADFLLQISSNRRARQVVQTLGLPLPMPERLERSPEPWSERPLHDREVVVGSGPSPELTATLARTLTAAGADPWIVGGADVLAVWRAAGEGWGRPPHDASAEGPARPWALVLDATGVARPEDLRALYDFFQPRVRSIARSGRLVVLGRPPHGAGSVRAAASRHALDGFVRSLGREVGRKGATANLITVEAGAEDRLPDVLRFFLSPRAAYVSGQPIRVTAQVARSPAPPPVVRPLHGRVAVVTGAARGIGEAIATVLAREGAKVVVVDRPDDDALGAEVARAVGGLFVPCDVTDAHGRERLVEQLRTTFGAVDVLVNNAGITRDKTLANLKPEAWDQTIAVNLSAVADLTDALEPLFAPNARVVCLSSIAGISGNVGQTNYAASKSGVIGLVEALAPVFATRGVAVNGIAPGFIETRLTHAIPVATREVARRLSNLGQGGLPVDVAEVVAFLSSPGAAALSGQVIRVCGGSFVGA